MAVSPIDRKRSSLLMASWSAADTGASESVDPGDDIIYLTNKKDSKGPPTLSKALFVYF